MSRVIDLAHYRGLGLTPHTVVHLAALLAAHPGLVVSSTYRTEAYNRQIGGAPRSFHTRGRGVDVVGPIGLLRSAARTARAQRVTAGCTGPEEVILEDEGRRNQHLHLAW